MYSVSTEFKNLIKAPSRNFSAKVLINDINYSDENIARINLYESVNMDESFVIGSVVSSKLELTLIGIDEIDAQDSIIKPSIGLDKNGVVEFVPLGIFHVDDIEKNEKTIKLTCFDNMGKLEKEYISSLNYPAPLNQIAAEICSKADINLASTLPSTRVARLDDVTMREALSYIASFIGGFARFNRNGDLEIKNYQESNINITGENYFELKTQEKPFVVGQIVCTAGERILRAGTGGSRLSFENPWMTQSQLNNIYGQLSQLSFLPYTMRWQGNPALEPGDRITITDINDNVYSTLLMEQELKYTGGLIAEASAKGETKNKQEFNYQGSITKQLENLQGAPRIVGTMLDLIETVGDIRAGTNVITKGYYVEDDGGAAEYIISNTELDWSIPLGNDKFANITNKDYVNYKMFGARLDGKTTETEAIKMCHAYADSKFYVDGNNCKVYTCWVKNNQGIIRTHDPIYCSGNVDLSGSTIIVDDFTENWFGSYVWGDNSGEYYSYNLNDEFKQSMKEGAFRLEVPDNFNENIVLHLEETHYEIRDDDGYLYDVDKGELMVHQKDGIFLTALGSDWTNAGGTVVHADESGDALTTEFKVSYTYIPTQHRTFKGCHVKFEGDADNYATVLWVRGHNCTVKDFTFDPVPETISNTRFKNSMIYVWGSYNVTIENCNGFNAAGRISDEVPTPTSGYAIRAYQASDLYIKNCNITGIWGSISVSSTKNCYIEYTTCNRIDVHDYITNLYVDHCIVYSHSLQIGSGSGSVVVRDTTFHYQNIPEERYPGRYLIALQAGYGRVFNGNIIIEGCKYIYLTDQENPSFYFVRVGFSPYARSIESKFKFPQITIRDFELSTVEPEDVFIGMLDISGSIASTSASVIPPVYGDVAYSGDTRWKKVQQTRDWYDGGFYEKGDVVRKMDRRIGEDGKTQFYNIEYYLVEEEGNYFFEPPETWFHPFSNLKRIYAPYYSPGADYNTTEGENFVVSPASKFFPEYVFSGNDGLKTSGNYPTHTSGIEWVGDDREMEGLYLEFEQADVTVNEWTENMNVVQGQLFTQDTRVYEVTQTGQLDDIPIPSMQWLDEIEVGTATVKYIGAIWVPGTWLPEGGLALVYSNPGYNKEDFTYNVYKVVNRDGRVLGDTLVPASGIVLDGGIIWKITDKSTVNDWQPNYAYNVGDTALINDVPHEVIYSTILEMPNKLTLENITHSSNYDPFIFAFAPQTNVPIEGELNVVIDSLSEYRGVSYNDRPFFGLPNNKVPVIKEKINNISSIDLTSILDSISNLETTVNNGFANMQNSIDDLTSRVQLLEDGTEEIYNTIVFYENSVGRWDSGNVIPSPQQQIGRLEITNNNDEKISFVIYESYGYGDFTWTTLKTIRLDPSEKAIEHVQLSGTRNNFAIQTRDSNGDLVDTSECVIEMIFSNKSNVQEPSIICP